MEFVIEDTRILCEQIPGDVCESCGEIYLAPKTAKKLDSFLKRARRIKPARYEPVAVFESNAVLE